MGIQKVEPVRQRFAGQAYELTRSSDRHGSWFGHRWPFPDPIRIPYPMDTQVSYLVGMQSALGTPRVRGTKRPRVRSIEENDSGSTPIVRARA